jgi:hypothetical protein
MRAARISIERQEKGAPKGTPCLQIGELCQLGINTVSMTWITPLD